VAFEKGNQDWKKRKADRGGRPTREAARKKQLKKAAMNREIKMWAEARTALMLAQVFGLKVGACPLCGKT